MSSPATITWHVNNLRTYEEVLQWYIDLNSGGTVHHEDELTRVKELIAHKATYLPPDEALIRIQSGLDRELLRNAQDKERGVEHA